MKGKESSPPEWLFTEAHREVQGWPLETLQFGICPREELFLPSRPGQFWLHTESLL